MREEPEQIRRRRVPVNWDDLKMALTWRSDELEYFLDLRSGEVRQYRLSAFTDGAEDFELSEDEATAGLAEGSLVRIEGAFRESRGRFVLGEFEATAGLAE